MEFNFTIITEKTDLIIKEEYPLMWLYNKETGSNLKIGFCKVQVLENQVNCTATLSTGGIINTFNDITISEFKHSDILEGKFEYGILFKEDLEGNENVYGFCLL